MKYFLNLIVSRINSVFFGCIKNKQFDHHNKLSIVTSENLTNRIAEEMYYKSSPVYQRIIFIALVMSSVSFVQSTARFTLITDNKINYSYVKDNYVLQQSISLAGIYGLLDFVVNLKDTEERFVSVSSQRRNVLLNEIMSGRVIDSNDNGDQYKRQFYHFNYDALKVSR